jgi:uncharacterized protein YndB with AHSA1/START domain
MTFRWLAVGAALAFAFVQRANADVVDSAANGFTVKTTLTVQATPEDVYKRLVHDVGEWWNSQHTFSGDAHNLSIDDKAGGCFCEKLANGGSVRHLEVVYAAPGKALTLIGALGPLQSLAAAGSMQIKLSPADGGTKLEVTYAIGGYSAAGLNTWAPPVDKVLAEQFTRLKNYVEHGSAVAK